MDHAPEFESRKQKAKIIVANKREDEKLENWRINLGKYHSLTKTNEFPKNTQNPDSLTKLERIIIHQVWQLLGRKEAEDKTPVTIVDFGGMIGSSFLK